MKHIVTLIFIILLLIGTLAGCGTSNNPSGGATGADHTHKQATEPANKEAQPTATEQQAASEPTAANTEGQNNSIKIVSSMPYAEDDSVGEQAYQGMRMALEEVNYQACDGKFNLVYEPWSDYDPEHGGWGAKQEQANAQRAVADPDVMVYLGPLNSGAAKISVPILNRADLVIISPSATWPGLTKPGRGELGEPDVYYPTGRRNFARVVPADDIQGVVAAEWAQELGAKRIFIVHDTETYGKGLAEIVRSEARGKGITVLGFEGFDKKQQNYSALAQKVVAANPDMVYFGAVTSDSFSALVKAIHQAGFRGKMLGPDGIYNNSMPAQLGAAADNLYLTFGGMPSDQLTGAGQRWYDKYVEKVGSEPDGYTPYMYESMAVAVDAINRVCVKDRNAIREAVLATRDFNGLFGPWSFDENGDTSLTTMSGLKIIDGKFEFVKLLNAGPY